MRDRPELPPLCGDYTPRERPQTPPASDSAPEPSCAFCTDTEYCFRHAGVSLAKSMSERRAQTPPAPTAEVTSPRFTPPTLQERLMAHLDEHEAQDAGGDWSLTGLILETVAALNAMSDYASNEHQNRIEAELENQGLYLQLATERAAHEADKIDAERWRAVRPMLSVVSLGPGRDYYLTSAVSIEKVWPISPDAFADAQIRASLPSSSTVSNQ